jgi:hypothetical protein
MKQKKSQASGGGFKIERCGGKNKGRNLIFSSVANEVIDRLNSVGAMSIVRTTDSKDTVVYSDSNVVLALGANTPGASGSLTVTEVDASPSITATTLVFPNGSVTDNGGGEAEIAFSSPLTVEEQDGTPSVANVNKIKFPNASVTDDTGGVVSVAFPAAGGVTQYRLKSVQGDYVTCRTWDGTTEGGTDVYIAKPMKLRNSITSATIDGVSVTYSYTTTVARTATISSVDEDQVIVPRYLADDLIYAISADYTSVSVSGTPLTKIDINADGRAWAKE